MVLLLKLQKEQSYEQIQAILRFTLKMIVMDYNLMVRFPFKYLCSSAVYITLKIAKIKHLDLKLRDRVKFMTSSLNLKLKDFYKTSEALLLLAQKFEDKLFFAKNLGKLKSLISL